MFEKPNKLPKFADENLIDSTTQMDNVLEPTAEQEKWGWFPYRKKPGRRVTNWLHRMYYRWIAWLNQEVETIKENDFKKIKELTGSLVMAPGYTAPSVLTTFTLNIYENSELFFFSFNFASEGEAYFYNPTAYGTFHLQFDDFGGLPEFMRESGFSLATDLICEDHNGNECKIFLTLEEHYGYETLYITRVDKLILLNKLRLFYYDFSFFKTK